MTESEPKQFWEKKILKWEKARYSPWLWFYPVSWTVRSRLQGAREVIRRRLPAGSSIMELGCGSGYLAQDLIGRCTQYFGVDIALNAIEAARERVKDPAFRFAAGDAAVYPLAPADLTVFLGLTDWLAEDQLARLFMRIRSKYILFSYTDAARLNPYRLYRVAMDRPVNEDSYRARTYRRAQIERMLEVAGYSFEFVSAPGLLDPGALVWAQRITHD